MVQNSPKHSILPFCLGGGKMELVRVGNGNLVEIQDKWV